MVCMPHCEKLLPVLVVFISTLPVTASLASPEKQMLKARFTTELATALKKLPPREALVVSLYYNEGMNFREVGEILDLSEARAYQIMSQALARIRSMLKEWLSGED